MGRGVAVPKGAKAVAYKDVSEFRKVGSYSNGESVYEEV